jgi:hypothetical protein
MFHVDLTPVCDARQGRRFAWLSWPFGSAGKFSLQKSDIRTG